MTSKTEHQLGPEFRRSRSMNVRKTLAMAGQILLETAVVGGIGTAIGKAIFPELPTQEIGQTVVGASLVGQTLVVPLLRFQNSWKVKFKSAAAVGALSIAGAGLILHDVTQKQQLPRVDNSAVCKQNGFKSGDKFMVGGQVLTCP